MLHASIAAGRIVQQEVGDWKTRWIRLTFIITYNVLEFVFICAVFYCETSIRHPLGNPFDVIGYGVATAPQMILV